MAITIEGTIFGDRLMGDPGNHNPADPEYRIFGYESDDELYGENNDDYLDGGTGVVRRRRQRSLGRRFRSRRDDRRLRCRHLRIPLDP